MECSLAKGELIRLDGGASGLLLRCSVGTVWLTCGDGTDHLISAGSSFKLDAHRVAVSEALESAEFYLAEQVTSGALLHKAGIRLAAC